LKETALFYQRHFSGFTFSAACYVD